MGSSIVVLALNGANALAATWAIPAPGSSQKKGYRVAEANGGNKKASAMDNGG